MHKRITFTIDEGNSTVKISDTLNDDCSWKAQAYLFHKFLAAQGYNLDMEDVGADIAEFVNSQVADDESW